MYSGIVIGFANTKIAINETSGILILRLNRTGPLESSFNVTSLLIHKSPSNVLLPNYITFPANESSVSVYGFIINDDKYRGLQSGNFCLVSSEHKNDIRFVEQCINITITDEEDCKLNV